MSFTVNVGNIGEVFNGESERDARLTFKTYVDRSEAYIGRCAGEDVILSKDDEPVEKYKGYLARLEAMSGSFMNPDIQKGYWWSVETSNGSFSLPSDCVDVEWSSKSTEAENMRHYPLFLDYAPENIGTIIVDDILSIEKVKGYGARLSAPGYLDCTEWTVFKTEKEAIEYLLENYEDDIVS